MMTASPMIILRVIKSYGLMLDFFGMELTDTETGTLMKSNNYQERIEWLNQCPRQYLRITRMLTFLNHMGLDQLIMPFVLQMQETIFHTKILPSAEAVT